MQLALQGILALELALLFAHEMDAVRKQEWKMFVILRDMEDQKAYEIFLLLHIPIYTAILFLLLSRSFAIGYLVVDAFLIVHLFIHWLFRNHSANRFHNGISKSIIISAGVLAFVHLLLIYFGQAFLPWDR